jgi:hypothetical protein
MSKTHIIKNPSKQGLAFLKAEMNKKRERQKQLIMNHAEFIDWAMKNYQWECATIPTHSGDVTSITWFWHTKSYSTDELMEVFLQLKDKEEKQSSKDRLEARLKKWREENGEMYVNVFSGIGDRLIASGCFYTIGEAYEHKLNNDRSGFDTICIGTYKLVKV